MPDSVDRAGEEQKQVGAVEAEAKRRYQARREDHVPLLPLWEDLSETERAAALEVVRRDQLARATKALALLTLAWPFGEDFDLDGLSADEPQVVDLLDTGRDITDEGFCHLNKAGTAFVNEVLAELFTPERHTSPSKAEAPDAS
jgi:hypothetical protein